MVKKERSTTSLTPSYKSARPTSPDGSTVAPKSFYQLDGDLTRSSMSLSRSSKSTRSTETPRSAMSSTTSLATSIESTESTESTRGKRRQHADHSRIEEEVEPSESIASARPTRPTSPAMSIKSTKPLSAPTESNKAQTWKKSKHLYSGEGYGVSVSMQIFKYCVKISFN